MSGLDLGTAGSPGPATDGSRQSNLEPEQCGQGGYTRRELGGMCSEDFPDGPMAENLPANAGDRFNPWSGKIPHALGQLSPCTTTIEHGP